MIVKARRVGTGFFAILLIASATQGIAEAAPVKPAVLPGGLSATSVALPGNVTGQTVVDAAHDHVFVAVTDANDVVVFDYAGNIVKTITGESGAAGMTLVGSHLYVALSTAGAIDDIDTSTLVRTRTLASGNVPGLNDLVAAAGALWVVTTVGNGHLVRVATSDGATTSYNPVAPFYATGLAGDPADANTLFVYTPGLSPVTIYKVDLATNPPSTVASQGEFSPSISNVNDVAVTPSGTHIIPAGGAPYQFDELNTSDLNWDGTVYTGDPYPTAVAATSAAGGLLAGGFNFGNPDFREYHLGNPAPFATIQLGTDEEVLRHSIAFSPDATYAFAVTGNIPTTTAHFWVIGPPPGINPTRMSVSFQNQRVGTFGSTQLVTLYNTTGADVSLTNMTLGGTNPNDFVAETDCFPSGAPRVLVAGDHCNLGMVFAPLVRGARSATITITFDGAGSPETINLTGSGTEGFFLAGTFGEVGPFGDAVYAGDATNLNLHAPMISIATTPNGAGYWLLGRDGGIFTYGNAKFYGSTGAMRLNQPVVGMAPTVDGKGYWLVASDGGIFTFGDAKFYGSTGAMRLNQPVVGMAPTVDGKGYWLVASDGGIFTFGDAKYHGSMGGHPLPAPVMQMARTPTGNGYWLLTADGHLYPFGDAHSYGTATGQPIVGMAITPDGKGYWEAARNGAVYHYGNASNYGSLAGLGVNDVVGIAQTAPDLPPELLTLAHARVTAALGGRASALSVSGHG